MPKASKTDKYSKTTNKFKFLLITLLIVVIIGTAGYALIENAPLIDALYMTIITLSTVGYGEVFKEGISLQGKIFTIVFILVGMSLFIYALSTVVRMIVEGQLTDYFRRKKMEKQISTMKNHYLICGISPISSNAISEFIDANIPFVLIDKDEEHINELQRKYTQELSYVIGNTSEEEILHQAGVSGAKGIICCYKEDADNGFTLLTAKEIKPELFAITIGNDESSEKKLKKMGADRVILPNLIGGKRIAGLVVRPEVLNFLDIITRQDSFELFIEEFYVQHNSQLADKTLKDSNIRQETDAIVIGIKNKSGKLTVNPKVTDIIKPDDKLIVLGEASQLDRLRVMAST